MFRNQHYIRHLLGIKQSTQNSGESKGEITLWREKEPFIQPWAYSRDAPDKVNATQRYDIQNKEIIKPLQALY